MPLAPPTSSASSLCWNVVFRHSTLHSQQLLRAWERPFRLVLTRCDMALSLPQLHHRRQLLRHFSLLVPVALSLFLLSPAHRHAFLLAAFVFVLFTSSASSSPLSVDLPDQCVYSSDSSPPPFLVSFLLPFVPDRSRALWHSLFLFGFGFGAGFSPWQ